jgi:hypothetical protein
MALPYLLPNLIKLLVINTDKLDSITYLEKGRRLFEYVEALETIIDGNRCQTNHLVPPRAGNRVNCS